MKAKFKIADLAAKDSVTKELTHPKHGDTGIMVTIAGPTHPKWRAALEKVDAAATGAVAEEQTRQLFASAILGWDEEAMGPYSEEAVLELLSNPAYDWITVQVIRTTQDHLAFFQ